jgi:hypothetical protein
MVLGLIMLTSFLGYKVHYSVGFITLFAGLFEIFKFHLELREITPTVTSFESRLRADSREVVLFHSEPVQCHVILFYLAHC